MPSTGEPVVAKVLALANDVHALAKRQRRDDLAALLAAEADRWKDATATIVVAGAQKRGKSRLLNALVERPELLPVDADVATDTYLAVRHGPALTATVRRRASGGGVEELRVDPGDIGEYASTMGDPASRRDVVGVDVTMAHPLLDGVRLVDTPGVDSLSIGHRHTTVAMLADADALLFALSAQDQPVLRHELEFLIEAAERIQAIAFVLTKVEDAPKWRELLAENRTRLATFVEQQRRDQPDRAAYYDRLLAAPWIPVSAKLAEAAAARRIAGQTERADELWQRSGMPRLTDYLRACSEGRELARCGRVILAVEAVLRAVSVSESDRLVASSEGEQAVAARVGEVQADLDLLAERAKDRRRFGIENQFLAREVGTLVRARLERLRQGYDDEITALANRQQVERYVAGLPDSLERSLEAAWRETLAEAQTLVATALTEFLTSMQVDAIDIDLATLALPATVRERMAFSRDVPNKVSVDMLREGIPAASMAASMGVLLAHVIAFPVAIVIGPALAAGVFWRRRQVEQASRDHSSVRRGVTDIFAAAAVELTTTLERSVAQWRSEAEHAVDATLVQQRKELEARRQELTTLAAQDANARKEAARQAQERLAAIAAMRERSTSLHAQVATAVNALGAAES